VRLFPDGDTKEPQVNNDENENENEGKNISDDNGDGGSPIDAGISNVTSQQGAGMLNSGRTTHLGRN
jgi:hypothetical protein